MTQNAPDHVAAPKAQSMAQSNAPPLDTMQQLHPRARIGFHVNAAIVAALPVLPVFFIARARDLELAALLGLVLAVALVLQLLAALYARAAFRRTRYRLDAEGLLIQRGVFWRSETRVARSRVQHTDIDHGPIDRWLGLADLRVHTAGTRLASVRLGGVSDARAHELRDALLSQADDAV